MAVTRHQSRIEADRPLYGTSRMHLDAEQLINRVDQHAVAAGLCDGAMKTDRPIFPAQLCALFADAEYNSIIAISLTPPVAAQTARRSVR